MCEMKNDKGGKQEINMLNLEGVAQLLFILFRLSDKQSNYCNNN